MLITSGRREGRQNSSADGGPKVELQFEEGIELTVRWYLENPMHNLANCYMQGIGTKEEWMDNITSGDYEKYYEEMYKGR